MLDSQQNDHFMQPELEHKHLTASATVDSNPVTMLTDRDSANAEAPLTVVNTLGFTLPATGAFSQMMLTIGGAALLAAALMLIALLLIRKTADDENSAG
jgi:hypothetical protein